MFVQQELVGAPFPQEISSRALLVHHVARRLGISRRMVRHLAQTGELKGYKAGPKIWQFLASDVDELRKKREARYV